MVVSVFPLAKIGLLLLKQLSKPLANIIKNEAKKHPLIRKHVIVPLGKGIFLNKITSLKSIKNLIKEVYNWTETKVSLKGAKEEIRTEDELVELGANAVGEIILFGFLCLILLAEMNRQGDKKAVLERTKAEEMTNLQDVVLELHNEIFDLRNQIQGLRKRIEVPPDIMELEEVRHIQIPDHEFWDIMASHGSKSRRVDLNSPSA